MKLNRSFFLCGLSLAAGVAGAFLLSPLFHQHGNPEGRISPMWAHSYDSLEQMTLDTDAVVVGRVLDTRPGRIVRVAGDQHLLPFTNVTVKVEQVLSGQAPAWLTLEQTGGVAQGQWFYVDGDGGAYRPGERVLLFLKKQADTSFYYLAHPKGRFQIRNEFLSAVDREDPVAAELDDKTVEMASFMIESIAATRPTGSRR